MRIYAKSGTMVHIGRVGENMVTEVIFDITKWFGAAEDSYIEDLTGELSLYINRDGATYIVTSATGDLFYDLTENKLITWKIKNSFLTAAGQGKCELRYSVSGQVIFSEIYNFLVTNSLDSAITTNPPDYLQNYMEILIDEAEYMHNNMASVESNAEDAADSAAAALGSANAAARSAIEAAEAGDYVTHNEYEDLQTVITTGIILASGWSNSTYSGLQTDYPFASYDLEIEANGDSITATQYSAWANAQIVGSVTTNVIKAMGTVPTVDIPIIIKYTPKIEVN